MSLTPPLIRNQKSWVAYWYWFVIIFILYHRCFPLLKRFGVRLRYITASNAFFLQAYWCFCVGWALVTWSQVICAMTVWRSMPIINFSLIQSRFLMEIRSTTFFVRLIRNRFKIAFTRWFAGCWEKRYFIPFGCWTSIFGLRLMAPVSFPSKSDTAPTA